MLLSKATYKWGQQKQSVTVQIEQRVQVLEGQIPQHQYVILLHQYVILQHQYDLAWCCRAEQQNAIQQ